MTTSIISEFHEEMLNIYNRSGRELGYWARRYLAAVKRHGGLEWAKRTLQTRPKNKIHAGLRRLIEAGRPELTVEALALNSRFSALFTKNELEEARKRLSYFRKPKTIPPEINYPEVVPKDGVYTEGAVRKIIINQYERNQAARNLCIKKKGVKCVVCEMAFEKKYGSIGKGFIHIHHLKPLATQRKTYKLDPAKDLVPVCPNCHAMLHTQDPPISIELLRQLISDTSS